MFAHKYVTFVLIDNNPNPEPVEITINAEMISSLLSRQHKSYSKLLSQEAHITTWTMELLSGSTLIVTLECPCTDTDEQGNQIDVDTDMAYDSFQEAKKRKTIEVSSLIWE